MKRRPLRRLLRAERLVAAQARGTPGHRTRSMRRPPDMEARKEARLQRFLRGWSQRKGGGWSIRSVPYRPVVPDVPCTLAEQPLEWPDWLRPVPWGMENGVSWAAVRGWMARRIAPYQTWVRQRWRWLRYAEPLPPRPEPTETTLAGWSLAALGMLLLSLILPRSIALWGASLIGAVQGMQLLNTGTTEEDGTGDKGDVGGKKLNNNLAFTLMAAATLNAGYFAVHPDTGVSLGYTAPQIVQAAINSAGGTPWYGKDYTADVVYVPKKANGVTLLPYDAVTFNNAVHMTREGGPGTNVWDPKAYGAAGDNSTDDYYALAACRDAASSLVISQGGTGGGIIELGPYNYKYSKPFLGTRQGTRIRGTGRGVAGDSRLTPSYNFGPAVLATDPVNLTVPLVAGLTADGGNALSCNQTNPGWFFNLRDAPAIDGLSGAATFTVRGYFTTSSIASGGALINSNAFSDELGTALSNNGLRVDFNGTQLRCLAKIGGVLQNIGGGTISNSTIYFWAASYDGATLRLYLAIPGTAGTTPIATTTASGTMELLRHSELTIGYGGFAGAGENGAVTASILGAQDSVEVLNVASYTGTITAPNSKFVAGANTLALLNFTEQLGSLTKGANKDGVGWFYRRDRTSASNGYDNFEISDCTIYGNNTCMGLILDRNNHRPYVRRVYFQQCRTAYMATQRDSYFGHLDTCWFSGPTSGGRYGILLGSFDAGIMQIDASQIDGDFTYPIVTFTSVAINKLFATSGASTAYFLLAQAGSAQIVATGCQWSVETGVGANYQGIIGLYGASQANCPQFTAMEGIYQTGGGKPIVVNKQSIAMFKGSNLTWSGTPPTVWSASLGTVAGWPLSGITTFENCPQPLGIKPFTDIAGAARVGDLGKGTALAFSASLTLDCSSRDEFEIGLLTGNVTLNFTNVTPGQNLKIWTKQDATGGRTITLQKDGVGGNVKNATAATTAANQTNQWVFDAMLDGTVNQIAFTTGI